MSEQKLFYTKYYTPETLQILITAQFVGKKIQTNQYNKKYDPVSLLTSKGILNKPTSILRYVAAGSNLVPKNVNELNELNVQFQFFDVEIYPLLVELYGQIFGEKAPNQKKFKYSLDQIHKNLKILDDSLKIKSFFIGHNITIFDISMVCYLENLFKLVITEGEFKKLSNLKRWFIYVRDIPIFSKFYGKRILCGNQAFKIDFKTQQTKVIEQQTKKEPQKVQAKKQEQVKKAQQSKQTEEGSFKLDDWKRQFQNSTNKIEIINKLLDNFEKEHWSIWKVHYEKDVTEGKVLFLTQNLANGTLQRLEGLRKTGFGSWGVYGEEGNYEIRGVMMWKGTEKHTAWKQHPSVEYHIFTRLEPSKQEDRNLILDYWTERQCAEELMQRYTKIIV